MFQLSQQDIHLGVAAADKQSAIRQVAAALTEAGCVSAAYCTTGDRHSNY